MPYWILAFGIGIGSGLLLRQLPDWSWLGWGGLTLIALKLIPFPRPIFKFLFAGSLGLLWLVVVSSKVMEWQLPPQLAGKAVAVTGYIATPPTPRGRSLSFELVTCTLAEQPVTTRLQLSWYRQPTVPLQVGDLWHLWVRLHPPHGLRNPGGSDLEKRLLLRRIRATGYVVDRLGYRKIASYRWRYPLNRWRQQLTQQLIATLGQNNLTAIIIALVVGVDSYLDQTSWQILRATGTSHLVAISGLHIGLIAGALAWLTKRLWRLSRRLPLWLPASEAGMIAGVIAGGLYAALAGFAIPTQRALIMLISFSVVLHLRRPHNAWQAWWWALGGVLLVDPLSLLATGCWLSFGAVAAIIYVMNHRIGLKTTWWSSWGRLQLAVTVMLLPLSFLFFQQVSLTTGMANLVAMPLFGMGIIPLSLLGTGLLGISPGLGKLLLSLGELLLKWSWQWLTFWAELPCHSWHQPIYQKWTLFAALIGVILLLAPRGFWARHLGPLWLAPLLLTHPPQPTNSGQFWLTVLDVGQGLAAVIQTVHHTLIYDTGPQWSSGDAGARIILPFLQQVGIHQIDTLVVSHGDNDHSGGAHSLLNNLQVRQIFSSAPEVLTPYPVKRCEAGQEWQWDGIKFRFLAPFPHLPLSGNNASCVLQISNGNHTVLLPGDIEKESEELLINHWGNQLAADVLIAPHHGSKTSSTSYWIELVQPAYVIFAVGYHNRFHLPHPEITTRYLNQGAQLLDLSSLGAVIFKFDAKSTMLYPQSYRETNRHFWHEH